MQLFWGALAVGAIMALGGKDKFEDELAATKDSFTRYDELFKKYGLIESVSWQMLKAISMNESSLGEAPSVARGIAAPNDWENSKSSDGKSWGLMQMTLPTLQDYDKIGNPTKLNNPEYSIQYAAKFLRWLQRQFPVVDPRYEEWVVKSYNQGAGNTRKEQQGIVGRYTNDVEAYWKRYQRNRKLIRDKQGE